jgi:hypothetical protein
MGDNLGNLHGEMSLDSGNWEQGINRASKATSAFSAMATGALMGVGLAATQMAANGARAMVAFGGDAVDAASHLNETLSKTNAIMGASAATIIGWSKSSARALGMTQQQALDAAGSFALFGKTAGLTNSQVAKFSTGLVGLAADLGSFYDSSPADALAAIQSGLRGETEPLRRYNIMLDDATMRQRALEMGIISSIKNALTPQQKILAATALIYEQSSQAQGDFAKTSGEYAGQQKVFAANMDTVGTTIGTAVLPAMKALATSANTLIEGVLPSLGAVVSQTLAPAMLDAARNVTVFAGQLSLFFDALAAGQDPLGSFIDAFDLEPMAEQMNTAIAAVESWVNASLAGFDQVRWGVADLAIAYTVQMNKIIEAVNTVANAGNAFFNSFGAKMASVTGNAFTPTPDIVVQQLKQVPMSMVRVPTPPVSFDRIPTTGGAPSALGFADAIRGVGAGDGATGIQQAGENIVSSFSDVGGAATSLASKFEGALNKVEGLFGTSSVTKGDMDRAAAGLPNNFADTWRRRAEDELINGVDWAEIDPAEVARSVGLDPSVPAQIIIDELNRQWNSGEYMADPANLVKIDWAAVQASLDRDAKAALGQKNIVAEGMARGITTESMAPVSQAIVTGATDALAASDLGTKTGDAATTAFNSPAGSDSLKRSGAAAYAWVMDGFNGAAAGLPWWNTLPGPISQGNGSFGGTGTSTPFGGGTLTQQPGTESGWTAPSTRPEGRRGSVNNVTVNVNGGGVAAAQAGRAARGGVLDALRARGQI